MTLSKFATIALSAALGLGAVPAVADSGQTLEAVKARGSLLCTGHDGSYLGFAEVDDKGNWKGLDIELCRAVATAIFARATDCLLHPTPWHHAGAGGDPED